jgi:hypothetical protein
MGTYSGGRYVSVSIAIHQNVRRIKVKTVRKEPDYLAQLLRPSKEKKKIFYYLKPSAQKIKKNSSQLKKAVQLPKLGEKYQGLFISLRKQLNHA